MRSRLPPFYVLFMTAVTAAYLTLEIPFSVHLIHVLGGQPSADDIDKLEKFGRVLTGIAVSIWIIGVLVFPRGYRKASPFLTSVLIATAVSTVATAVTYEALNEIATATGSTSTGPKRKQAFLSVLARNQIVSHGGVDGLIRSGSNDWNAFAALAPSLSSSDAMIKVMGTSQSEMIKGEALRIIGNEDAHRAAVFGERFQPIRSAYQRYTEGSKEYLAAKAGLDAKAADAWNQFQAELRRRYPKGLPGQGFTHAMIVRHVKFQMNIPVDQNWSIRDRAGFIGPYKRAASEKIEEAYRREVALWLGEGQRIDAGLDIDGFSSHPVIQKQVREALGLTSATVAITPGMASAAFRTQVYTPHLTAAERELEDAASADPSEFEGGRFAERGVSAVKAARLPALAILLSIAGAALHVFKFSGYAAQIAGYGLRLPQLARGKTRYAIAAAAVVAVFGSFAVTGNAVISSEAFRELKADGPYAALLQGAISIQPEFSELGTAVGSVGGWLAVAAYLPAPVTAAEAARPQFDSIDNIPVPTPRPDANPEG